MSFILDTQQKVLSIMERNIMECRIKIEHGGLGVGSFVAEPGSDYIMVVQYMNELMVSAVGLCLTETEDKYVAYAETLDICDIEVQDPSRVNIGKAIWKLRDEIINGRHIYTSPKCIRISNKQRREKRKGSYIQ